MGPTTSSALSGASLNGPSLVHTPTVKVIVGAEGNQQEFFVHVGLITSRSPFFEKALSGEWREAEDKIVTMPEDDPLRPDSNQVCCSLKCMMDRERWYRHRNTLA
ncbi:hypothetical protein BDV96DRAFT_136984 [Lophiotrema nucula]|uniref:BTB domain-containing protein n=1 Tax=Lophiotrema nucula TaxID=690887 RepID=A0A6A5ZSU9_9PLEO|nr:hypothetical protein BDV96DRAFT_136984 [Lophiotrema nucula]